MSSGSSTGPPSARYYRMATRQTQVVKIKFYIWTKVITYWSSRSIHNFVIFYHWNWIRKKFKISHIALKICKSIQNYSIGLVHFCWYKNEIKYVACGFSFVLSSQVQKISRKNAVALNSLIKIVEKSIDKFLSTVKKPYKITKKQITKSEL